MGLFARILGRGDASRQGPGEAVVVGSVVTPGVAVLPSSSIGLEGLHKVADTTTFRRPDAQQVAQALLRDRDGYEVTTAVVFHAPADEDRPEALDVVVEGRRIGSLPSYTTERTTLPVGASTTVPVQLCAADTAKGPRLDAWAWLGGGEPEWEYSQDHRPPVTAKERSAEAASSTRSMVLEALAEGGKRRAQFLAGSVNGIHYLKTVEPIKQLKREGQLEAALQLCYIGIQGAEGNPQFGTPPPWYTIQAAIIHRKLKQTDQEIAVLERWLAHCPEDERADSGVQERLDKLRARQAKPTRPQ